MRYKVRLKKSEEGYAVWCPGLPGCPSQGQTEAEALDNIKDAIAVYLETVEEVSRDVTWFVCTKVRSVYYMNTYYYTHRSTNAHQLNSTISYRRVGRERKLSDQHFPTGL